MSVTANKGYCFNGPYCEPDERCLCHRTEEEWEEIERFNRLSSLSYSIDCRINKMTADDVRKNPDYFKALILTNIFARQKMYSKK